MTFGTGLPVHLGHEDVAGLEVPVDHPFLVRVLYALADLGEKLECAARWSAGAGRSNR